MNESEPTDEGIQSVRTAFEVAEALRGGDARGVTAISNELGIAKSTVYNHLTTLEGNGYVIKTDDGYKLGLRFLDLGYHARSGYTLYEVAKPEVDALVAETGDRCQLMVREGTEGVYVYQASGDQAITTDSHIGTRVTLHSTAVGKAYLAHLSEGRLETLLERIELPELTENTITDLDGLEAELERCRDLGYALNDEERIRGMRAVGAPIQSEDGTVLGALSVSGTTTRLNEERFRTELPEAVLRISRVIGIRATYP